MEDDTEFDVNKLISDSKSLDLCYAKAINKGGKSVLKDLREYCQWGQSAYNDDARKEAYNLGIQSVMIYIQNRLDKKFTKQLIKIKENEESITNGN
jgi:hypothetical protein